MQEHFIAVRQYQKGRHESGANLEDKMRLILTIMLL